MTPHARTGEMDEAQRAALLPLCCQAWAAEAARQWARDTAGDARPLGRTFSSADTPAAGGRRGDHNPGWRLAAPNP